MPELVPVEGDPFLQPVEGDPFAEGMTLKGNVAEVAKKLETEHAGRLQTLGALAARYTLPGRVAAGVQPTTPGMMTEEDAFRINQLQSEAEGWGPEQAAAMLKVGVPMAGKGTLGTSGGGIKAYHGSPHDFEQFDVSKIGTGEGVQAYGHGLYFAENPKVAADYAKKLGGGNPDKVKPDEEAIAAIKPKWDEIVTQLRVAREKSGGRMTDETSALQNHLDALNDHAVADTLSRKPWLTEGRRYEVNINADPEHFLDWDKPLSEQHPKVQEAANTVYPVGSGNITGSDFYRAVGRHFPQTSIEGGNARLAAIDKLREAGIPGVKYLDQGSRGEGEGTHNYVVFHHSIVDILKKYGLAGLVAGGAAHFKTQPHEGDPFADSQ